MKDFITIKFKIWRQLSNESKGSYEEFSLEKVSVKISLLEALDQLNEELTTKNIRPITIGEIIFPKNKPNLNQILFKGDKNFEFNSPKARKANETIKDHNLILSLIHI